MTCNKLSREIDEEEERGINWILFFSAVSSIDYENHRKYFYCRRKFLACLWGTHLGENILSLQLHNFIIWLQDLNDHRDNCNSYENIKFLHTVVTTTHPTSKWTLSSNHLWLRTYVCNFRTRAHQIFTWTYEQYFQFAGVYYDVLCIEEICTEMT